MKKGLSILLVLCVLMCTLLTGCGKPSVNLSNYIEVTDTGYDGYGKISVSLNYDKLIKDYADNLTDKNLDSSYLGVKAPDIAASSVFEFQKPYKLLYENSYTFKNGDKVEFDWEINETAVETLGKILVVDIKCDKFTHTVKDLKPLTEVDPFANIDYDKGGFSGNGTINSAKAKYKNQGGSELKWDLEFDKTKNGTLSNGDTISFSLSGDDSKEYYASEYGIKLTRTTADIKLEVLPYFPIQNPKEIFEYFSETDKQNVIEAVKDKYKKYAGNIEVEYVGAVFYYADTIDFTAVDYYKNNKLAFIFHVTNGIEPDGWYTYMSPDSVYIYLEKNEEEKFVKKTAVGYPFVQHSFPKKEGNYTSPNKYSTKKGPATYFTYNNLYYEGSQTIKDCIEMFTYYNVTNVTKLFSGKKVETPYNHVVVTDNLKQYVKEY